MQLNAAMPPIRRSDWLLMHSVSDWLLMHSVSDWLLTHSVSIQQILWILLEPIRAMAL